MLIQSPGDKLKLFRQKHHIRQYELCGDIITRNMLSMIENNKTPLNSQTARKLLAHIRQLCLEKDLPCTLSDEDLLTTPESQVIELTQRTIEHIEIGAIEDPLQDPLVNELLIFQERYHLGYENALLHFCLGTYCQKNKDCQSAYTHYLKALAHTPILQKRNSETLSLAYIRAMYSCIQLNFYQEAINLYQTAYLHIDKFSDASVYSLTFNAILSYRSISKYKEALNKIINLEYKYAQYLNNNLDKKINLLICKANTYQDCNLYKESIDIYQDLLTLCEDQLQSYLLILINMSDVFRLQQQTTEVVYYLDKFNTLLPSYEELNLKGYTVTFNFYLGTSYHYLNQYKLSETYYLNALNGILQGTQTNLLLDVVNGIYTLAVDSKNYHLLHALENVFNQAALCNTLIKTPLPFEIIDLYTQLGDLQKVQHLTKIILNTLHVASN